MFFIHIRNPPGWIKIIWKTENATLFEQFQNLEKTENATLSEQFQNLEKQEMPHCRNSSKIEKNRKCHTVGTVPKSRKTENATLSEQFQNPIKISYKQRLNRYTWWFTFLTWYRRFNKTSGGLNQAYGFKPILLMKWPGHANVFNTRAKC